MCQCFCYYRKIITERALEKDTLDAQAAELERQKRLAEIKKTMLKQQTRIKQEFEEQKPVIKPEKDSQLKSLLQCKYTWRDMKT